MNLKVAVAILNTDSPVIENASKLRGFFGNSFQDHILLHHHIGGLSYLYTYPRIQYKVIEGTPIIVGINEGTDIIKEVVDELNVLTLGGNRYRVEKLNLISYSKYFGKRRNSINYRFVTPWLAFNKDNYEEYKGLKDWSEKKELINGILIGNILSMCKGLNYTVKGNLFAYSHLDQTNVDFKGISHIGFVGEFKVNFEIPEFLGIGKSVSHGYGTVKNYQK